GLLIAGALAAWVPESFWKVFFLTDQPQLAILWGPLVGPIVSVVSFVCSIGNVPLAAVLWNSGISFGGVISFIFADLLILPILSIKRRYYGTRMTIFLFATFYAAMAIAGLLVELLFGALGLIPAMRNALVAEPSLSLNYTTVLNALFIGLAGVLLVRAWRTGGFAMLAMMDQKGAHSERDGAGGLT
ncbi:MAG TPA: permease, partial [Candidatus Limnocylindria bacterium]